MRADTRTPSIIQSGAQRLLDDVRAGKVDVIVVYKVDRLTRSLADFAKLVELFDRQNVLQGAPERVGSVRRVLASEIEALVTRSIRDHLKPVAPGDDRGVTGIRTVEPSLFGSRSPFPGNGILGAEKNA